MTRPLSHRSLSTASLGLALVLAAAMPGTAMADAAKSPTEPRVVVTAQSYEQVLSRLEKSIAENKMRLVAQASASKGAASRGVKIPGNTVLMVFRPDFAIRMLKASIPAGIEAPLRIYVTENATGSSITYH